jgi:DNA-binding response OmpR family regulator
VRTTSANAALPDVFALAESEHQARSAGCDSFLTKPCLPQDLVVEIRRLLSRSKPG